MRTHTIPITITIPFPYKNPDGNGVIYNKNAIKKGLKQDVKGMPICIVDGSGKRSVIGAVTTNFIPALWDDKDGVCRAIVQGEIFAGGTDCYVEFDKNTNTVKSIEFTSIGFDVSAK